MNRRSLRRGTVRYPAIAVVAALNAIAAFAGASGLAFGFLKLDDVAVSRLPLHSTILGGLALALLVALPNAVLTVLAVRGRPLTGLLGTVVGALLVAWILVELAVIRELSFFHPLYVAVGLLQIWLGAGAVRRSTGVSRWTLARETRDCVVDLPVFLTAPVFRRWHLRWGATDAETRAELPGDDLVPRPSYVSTRAITIDAPVDQVWPWLVQVGCLRGGFYSNDLLDNLGHPSARFIDPGLQGLALGQPVPMSPSPTASTAFRVASFDIPRQLLWSKPGSTWAWQLAPAESGGTRLVTRVRAAHDWSRPTAAVSSLLLLELGDFAMMRRMLRGIKERAEFSVRSSNRAAIPRESTHEANRAAP